MSLAYHDNVLSPCCLQEGNAVIVTGRKLPLKPEGKAAHTTATVSLTYFGSMMFLVENTVLQQEGI